MKFDEDIVREEIENAEEGTRFYFGCDSRRYKNKRNEWWISYATVIVIHIGGIHGCRVYGLIEKERDWTGNMKMRLVRESHKAVEMVMKFEEDLILNDVEFEVHLDINSDKNCKSNIAMKEAAGYVLGMLGIQPLFKPEAFASSCAADVFENKKYDVPKRKSRAFLRKEHSGLVGEHTTKLVKS